jgi:hypothetical protein
MQLLINGDKLVREVQQEFTGAYPFLKIEFIKNADVHTNHVQNLILHNQKLSDAWVYKKAEGNLLIDDRMSVTDLENAFMDQFGLKTQVFRKSGNIWLETSVTDSWTLKQQNDYGREITTGKKAGDRDENDYELHRNED